MKSLVLSGCGTALVTPFRNGEVDYAAFSRLLDRQVAAGIHFLVPLGTTGETPCLEEEERIKILMLAREKCPDRPVIVGGGTNSLVQTIRSLQLLAQYGPDAFLVVVPYYNKPTQEGIYEYFKAVAEEVGKPVVMYNVPSRTGVNMTAETALRLAEIENIVAVKEASGNYAQISEIIRCAPEGFSVLSGNDDETLPLMATGALGVVSVASNIAPELMVRLTESLLSGNLAEARELHHRLTPLFRNCFIESNPVPVKAGLAAMGLIAEEFRLPLVPGTRKTFETMRRTAEELGLPVPDSRD